MSQITLATIRTRILEFANMENSSFVSTTEVNDRINTMAKELYDLMISTYESDYVVSATVTIDSTGVYSLSSLPSTFYRLVGVDRLHSGQYVEVKRFNWSERNRNAGIGSLYGESVKYSLVGDTLTFAPASQASGTYKIWYIPELTNYTSDSSIISFPNNFHDYIIAGVTADLLAKEESDPSYWMKKKSDVEKRIKTMNSNRDAANSFSMRKVSRYNEEDF